MLKILFAIFVARFNVRVEYFIFSSEVSLVYLLFSLLLTVSTSCLVNKMFTVLRCVRSAVRGRLLVIAAGHQSIRLPINHRLRCRRAGGASQHVAALHQPGALPGNQRRGIISPVGALHSLTLRQRPVESADLRPRRLRNSLEDSEPPLLRPRRMYARQWRDPESAGCRLCSATAAERAKLS